jgi:hypothetical protein
VARGSSASPDETESPRVMGDQQFDWRALEEEVHRPIPTAERALIEICWEQWPGPYRVTKPLASLTDEELYDFVRRGLLEMERRVEGPMSVALLLRRFGGWDWTWA